MRTSKIILALALMTVCQSVNAQESSPPVLELDKYIHLNTDSTGPIIFHPDTKVIVTPPPKKGFKAACKRLATTAYKKTLAKPISITYGGACWTSEKVEPLLPLFSAVQMGSNTLIPWALTAWSRRN